MSFGNEAPAGYAPVEDAGGTIFAMTTDQHLGISCEHLSYFYPSRGFLLRRRPPQRALDDVNFTITQGEVVGLLGPNGAGKSTLLRILSTLLIPTNGAAHVLHHNVVDAPLRVRGVLGVCLSDERSFYWRLSGYENLLFFGALQGLWGSQLNEAVKNGLQRVGLTAAQDKKVSDYSSGMRQRLMLARALLHRPRVVILDEPTRSLDPGSRKAFGAWIVSELKNRENMAVLWATHQRDEAAELCDRVLVLDKGRIVANGRASDVLHTADEIFQREAAGLFSAGTT